ncbi:MAG TPA: phage/plasmid replication protein, II/X family [Methylobacter sp.]|jgi:II/X family phage/plasmid replication protein
MIDWFRGEVDFLHDPLPAGRVLSIEADGTLEWDCVKSIICRSSHETSIKIKSSGGDGQGRATSLMIDGNLCKFLQGHNVFGSRDLNTLLLLAFRKIIQLHAEHLHNCSDPKLTEARIKKGDYKVKMLDINQLYDVGNDASVESWLHAAGMRALSRHGRAKRDKGTVYLGQTSRRWGLKFYNKAREMLARGITHQLPFHLQNLGLEDFVKGKLRAELRIFSKELEKHGITHGYHLNPDLINQLFNDYLGKIEMTTQVHLIDDQILKLPKPIQLTYKNWRDGVDLRSFLPKNTFYRHRRSLLLFGIDINSNHLTPEQNNVVPMMRIIEAVPVAIPSWAYQRGLIAA